MMRALRAEGWTPKFGGRKDWAAVLGKSFGAGVGVYNGLRREIEQGGGTMPARTLQARLSLLGAAVGSADRVLNQEVAQLERIGMVVDPEGEEYLKVLSKRVKKAVTEYVTNDPIPDTWRIIEVEESLGPDAGNARPDFMVRDDMGLAVVDLKSKLTLKAEYRQKTINEYANGHQFLHYAHFGQIKYGEPIERYYIGLAVLEPRWAFELVPFPVHAETLRVWFQGSSRAWAAMEEEDKGDALPWMSDRHSDQFGQCPYYKACFVHHYDAGLMKQDYLLTERVTEEVPDEVSG